MQFLDINGVKRIKRYTDDTFVTSEDVSEIEDASLDFYTKSEIDEMISDVEAEIQSGGSGITSETDPVFTASPAHGITSANISTWNAKQNALVSGTNIKTVNNTSLLGSGNVAVQPTLVSGTNIKTVNGESLLGSGNVTISKIGTDTIGSMSRPIYLNSGTPTAITSVASDYIGWPLVNHNNLTSLENLYYTSGINTFAYLKTSYVDVEYSNDGGET